MVQDILGAWTENRSFCGLNNTSSQTHHHTRQMNVTALETYCTLTTQRKKKIQIGKWKVA